MTCFRPNAEPNHVVSLTEARAMYNAVDIELFEYIYYIV